jgi:hypothetical protein
MGELKQEARSQKTKSEENLNKASLVFAAVAAVYDRRLVKL